MAVSSSLYPHFVCSEDTPISAYTNRLPDPSSENRKACRAVGAVRLGTRTRATGNRDRHGAEEARVRENLCVIQGEKLYAVQ